MTKFITTGAFAVLLLGGAAIAQEATDPTADADAIEITETVEVEVMAEAAATEATDEVTQVEAEVTEVTEETVEAEAETTEETIEAAEVEIAVEEVTAEE